MINTVSGIILQNDKYCFWYHFAEWYILFLVSFCRMINTEERTLTASPGAAVVELTQPKSYRRCADLCTPLLKAGATLKTNRLLCAWLVFVFIGQSIGQKNIWRNLTASHYFRPVPKIEKRWLRYSNCCAANFSIQRAAYCHFSENKV